MLAHLKYIGNKNPAKTPKSKSTVAPVAKSTPAPGPLITPAEQTCKLGLPGELGGEAAVQASPT